MLHLAGQIACLLLILQPSIGSETEVHFNLVKSNHSAKFRTLLTAELSIAVCADNVTNTTANTICQSLNYESGQLLSTNLTSVVQPIILMSHLVCPDTSLSNCSYKVGMLGDCLTGALHLQCAPHYLAHCSPGKQWDSQLKQCVKCPNDTYSRGGPHSTECVHCPPGMRSGRGSGGCELKCRFTQHWNKKISKCIDSCPDTRNYGDGMTCQPCSGGGGILGTICGDDSPLTVGHWTRVLLGGAGGVLLSAVVSILVLYCNRDGQCGVGCGIGCRRGCRRGCWRGFCGALASILKPNRYGHLKEESVDEDVGQAGSSTKSRVATSQISEI